MIVINSMIGKKYTSQIGERMYNFVKKNKKNIFQNFNSVSMNKSPRQIQTHICGSKLNTITSKLHV